MASYFNVTFICFLAISLIVYYLVPKKIRWVILLLASVCYYLSISLPAGFFLLYAAIATWTASLYIQKIYDASGEGSSDKSDKRASRPAMIAGVVLGLGMLCVLKYTNFVIENINALIHGDLSFVNFILPLGVSYYTLMSLGYLLDVYWKRMPAEKNFFKYLLFLSFFPQLLQGPIGRYNKLSPQLLGGRGFDLHQIKLGLMRILWGAFKVMLLGGWSDIFATAIFDDPDTYAGIAIFGVLLFSVQLYANFSGGIDMTIGIAQLFGIQLDENFRRPYFSKSISEFWQRWHMTLGSWMRDYVFYPITLSKRIQATGKWAKKHWGRVVGVMLPVSIADLIVFFLTGIWHGAAWGFIAWGLYNGVIIAFSNLMKGPYKTWKKKLHINDKSTGWKIFQMCRTFALINLSWYFECTTPGGMLTMIKYSLTRFAPSQFLQIPAGQLGLDFTPYALLIFVIGTAVLIGASIYQEKHGDIREALCRKHFALQLIVCLLGLAALVACSPMAQTGGFIYAQF